MFKIFAALLLTTSSLFAQHIKVDNANPRYDVTGKIVDAHDGRIIQFDNKYYWYGTSYGKTNGFTNANTYVCYSSPNMMDWTFEGKLLQGEKPGVYYRPHVVYNKKNKQYILWFNWNPTLWNGQFGVATSNKPTGPFTMLNENVKVKNSALGVGDLGVFIDDDEVAYLSYNTIQNHKLSVEKLDENYTASTMQGSPIIIEHCEAGGMFKKNGLYYLLTDYTCCFCTQGSGAQVFTASNPLGPYNFRQNINRYTGELKPILNDGNVNDNFFETLSAKKNEYAELHFDKPASLSEISIHQFTGNRNGQCGEVNNPILHQPIVQVNFKLSYFYDGEWKIIPNINSIINKKSQQQIYTCGFTSIKAEKIKIKPIFTDSTQTIQIAEIKTNYKKFKGFVSNPSFYGKPIIPAQQTFVMPLQTKKGITYIWMGDLWGSASNGIKGEDYQYWSKPLEFYSNGLIKQLTFEEKFTIKK
jgi:hypothetical protein